MSDALPLPPRPNLDQYRKLAKDLKRACEADDPSAIHQWASRWLNALATLRGIEVTPPVQRDIDREAANIERRWRDAHKTIAVGADCRLADAQFFIAREHGFASWPTFSAHVEALTREQSPVSNFERAVDAIVNGEIRSLETLLRDHPQLVHERSTREHRSTLLHYVSANGVEDFRQKTPDNIVEITTLLLDAGAEVNAESDAYGGGSTPLGLVATSIHPQQAGVQIPLLELLLDRGSRLDQSSAGNGHPVVNGCFANGQPDAARYLARRGAPIDLEAAAGLGELAVVQSYFDEHGKLKSSTDERQMKSAFVHACGYGHEEVMTFLLQCGIDLKSDEDVRACLPWSIHGGHPNIVRFLLQRGVPVNCPRGQRAGPFELALGLWARSEDEHEREIYYEIVRLLIDAGAMLNREWFKQDDRRQQELAGKIRSDQRMKALLGDQMI